MIIGRIQRLGTTMKIAIESAVAFDFVLKDEDGTVLDSSAGKYPYEYLHGYQQVVPGLEKALEGKSAGDSFVITLSPEEGYGPRDENYTTELSRSEFSDDELEVGNQLYIMGMTGPKLSPILSFDDEKVVFDANHPLAGKTLTYEIEVLGVRESTSSERGCGHVHAPIATNRN